MLVSASQAETVSAPITAAACSIDGKYLVVGSQHGIEIRSMIERDVVASLPTKLDHVHDLKFSPVGQTLLAAGGSPAEFGAVERWDWPTRSLTSTVREHEDLVYCVAWNPAGTQWAAAGWDGVCHSFDAASGEKQATYLGHSRPLLAIDYLPDGETIASAGVDQTIQLWQGETATAVRTLSNHVNTVNAIAVAPPPAIGGLPRLASVSDDMTLRLWQPTIGRLVRFAKLASRPTSVAWLSGNQQLAVGCEDGTVHWFDAATLAPQRQDVVSQSPILSLATSPIRGELIIGDAAGQLTQRSE
ncbi:MAG: WD40 repeat domain-containing protein [Planctomycetaceae bacterium]